MVGRIIDKKNIRPWFPNSEQDFLGVVVQLMVASPLHRRWLISDVERLLLTPYRLAQFRTYKRADQSVGLVTWARLSETCAAELAGGIRKMQPADWVSGSQVWIIDFVAPFGGVWAIISDLRQIYVGHGFALRRRQDGKIRKLVKFNNYDRGFINPRSDFIEPPLPDSYEDGAL